MLGVTDLFAGRAMTWCLLWVHVGPQLGDIQVFGRGV